MRIDPSGLDAKNLYKLMISVVVPRPIAWVSTQSAAGVTNAAPFSYYQALSSKPPTVMISVGRKRDGTPKDTRANIEATKEFVVNVVSEASAERMVSTSIEFDAGVSEFDAVGLEAVPSEIVKPPRIAESAVSMECRLVDRLEVGNSGILIGEVVLFHVRDDVLTPKNTVDPKKLAPLGRLGGMTYAPLREVMEITRDTGAGALSSELVDLWRELRERSIAIVNALEPEHLARRYADEGMPVGLMLRHLAACTRFRVRTWEQRAPDARQEWDESWTTERIARELEDDRDAFIAAVLPRLAAADVRWQLQRMIRHEGWHQGQIAAALRTEFEEDEIWQL